MKKLYLSLIFILLFSPLLLAATPSANIKTKTGIINVVITGFRNSNGVANISLYNTPDSFPSLSCYKSLKVKIDAATNSVTTMFSAIPYGTYAIAFFHDEDNSGKLEYNLFGMPLDGFGFSTNFKPTVSAPKFNAVSFQLNNPSVTENITVIYM